MVNLANQGSHANTGRSKAIKRGDHNAFTPYHPACFLLANHPAFFWTIRSNNESRGFSLKTDIRVWKNAVRCFKNNILKPQEVKNDLRHVLFKIIIFYLFAFLFLLFYFTLLFFLFSNFQVRTYVRAYR